MTTHELAKLLLEGPNVSVLELPESVCRPLLEAGFDLGYQACAREHSINTHDDPDLNLFRARAPSEIQ